MGASEPVDRLLDEAGAQWRAAQPEPRPVTAAMFESDRGPGAGRIGAGHAWAFVAGAVSTVALVVALAVAAPGLLPRIGGAGPAPNGAPDRTYIASGLANCPLTKPVPPFTPPPAPGADYDLDEGASWYGTASLWTRLNTDGEIWSALPVSAAGRSQKTFWWRQGYNVHADPTPPIGVSGTRLDGPGRFVFGPPGTNAAFGQGAAMLVGIEIPEPGCWEITGTYGADSLTYVVWVGR